MALKLRRAALVASLLAASSASAVSLTLTPDKSTYLVGETIALTVSGDPGTAMDNAISGRLLFDPGLAVFEGAEQTALTSFGGGLSWTTGLLSAGSGFADAFNQFVGSPRPADCCLMAQVRLRATAPGALGYSWNTSGFILDFFGLTSAPGGSVTIVPEPATGLLLALGLAATALIRRRGR